jgi:hypothetical protein
MDNLNNVQRKNFRCIFGPYITKDNREGVIQSVIAQFQGYGANPEVTVDDDGFIITLDTSSELSANAVRDKILWNKFIERVTTQDAIRKIQIIRLPKAEASLMDFGARPPEKGTVGGFGPDVDPVTGDTGVDEVLLGVEHTEYRIDNADRPGGPKVKHRQIPKVFNANKKIADKTDLISEDQTFVKGLTPEGLTSRVNDMHANDDEKTVLGSFRRISIDSDFGGNLTPKTFEGLADVEEAPPGTGIAGDAPISGASWYVYQPGNAQGTELGVERNRYRDHSEAPFGNISDANLTHGSKEEEPLEDDFSAVQLPQARGGGQAVPDGGQIEGWYANKENCAKLSGHKLIEHLMETDHNFVVQFGRIASADIVPNHIYEDAILYHNRKIINGDLCIVANFGINETYDYEGDVDGYDI